MKKYHNFFAILIDCVCITLGTAIYALAFLFFYDPNHISPGGVTGLAAILSHAIGTPIGITALILNIPLLIAAIRTFGLKFMAYTAIGTICSTLFLDLFSFITISYTGERVMASLAGGLCAGFGLGLTILRGASTGGTDIAAKLITRRNPYFSIGKMLLILDATVVAASSLFYGELESGLYSVFALFISTKTIDVILYGADRGEIFYIVTEKPQEILDRILQDVNRGVSKIQICGGYTNKSQQMLFCVVRRPQIVRVRNIIKQCDKNAFVVMAPADEILGSGFKNLD